MASIELSPNLTALVAGNAAVIAGVREAAVAILAGSQQLVPVRTGELKASGHVVATQARDEGGRFASGFTAASVVYDTDYASYVEFGTSDTPAFAYLRRGCELAGYSHNLGA